MKKIKLSLRDYFLIVIQAIATITMIKLFLFSTSSYGMVSPTICDVVKTPQFRTIMQFNYRYDWCGWPVPRPCARFDYNIPKYFIEVVDRAGDTYFKDLPPAQLQLSALIPEAPYVSYDDHGSYSGHAHTMRVPLAMPMLSGLPCGGTLRDLLCFSSMSEHTGVHWRTGKNDLTQPSFLAWSSTPKACLLKGAATSALGNILPSAGSDIGSCSIPLELPIYPPSTYPVCTGWGLHFPRTGTVDSSDSTTASLMLASRIKSLSSEVFQGFQGSANYTWQMIYPTPSMGFLEGENTISMRTKSVSEIGRLKAKPSKFLYTVWDRVSCTADVPWIAASETWLATLESACKGAL